ncbi:MAG TPA: hypothetical protein P5230_04390 [Candidatus Magasanikbacteria bacterium]|nr:hypothetical protein [Candidatus Magasanikbacteria bacterium]
MTKIKNFFKLYLGEILIIIGIFIFSSNILNFSSYPITKKGLGCTAGKHCDPVYAVEYNYDQTTQKKVSFGSTLIVVGLLIKKPKN